MPNEGWSKLMTEVEAAFEVGDRKAIARILEKIVRAGLGSEVNHDIPVVREAHLGLRAAAAAAEQGDLERARFMYRQNIADLARDR